MIYRKEGVSELLTPVHLTRCPMKRRPPHLNVRTCLAAVCPFPNIAGELW